MLTDTPLDLTPFGAALRSVGFLIWVLIALAIWWAVRGRRPWRTKVLRLLPVLALIGYGGHGVVTKSFQRYEWQKRQKASEEQFVERCRSVGEKIYRTVANVEGVVWMRWRDKVPSKYWSDQFARWDPYGSDCTDESCVSNLLRVTSGEELDPTGKYADRNSVAFAYVEATDPRDGQMYRYTKRVIDPPDRAPVTDLVKLPIDQFAAQYGVTWEDISTDEDRFHWIAGGKLSVVNIHTGEVLGERIGYLRDRGLGSEAGFRTPWTWAVNDACPAFASLSKTSPHPKRTYLETRDFVISVLHSR